MMKRLSAILILLFSCIGLSVAQHSNWREERLQEYMNRFPQSQLRDVYKYCFQDYFGLEHLLSDSMAAVRYIEYELHNSDTNDWHSPLFHYSLLNSNYVRVDINYVRKGMVPMGIMVSAMLQSTAGVEPVDAGRIELWKAEWRLLRNALLEVRPLPKNFVEESDLIDSLLVSGQYAMHHSVLYNKSYHQHYRIIRHDVFDKLIKPLISCSKD